MVDPILARDLMITGFETVGSGETLRAALRKLVALQDRTTEPSAVVVLDADGQYQGLLTAHLLARSLCATWSPSDSEAGDDLALSKGLLVAARQFLNRPIGETLEQEVAVVGPGARLLEVIAAGSISRLEFLPVVEAGQILGLVPVTAVFQATASLTLTPEHEGIRFDQDD